MPLPTPTNKESHSNFMDRCMLDLSKKEEFKNNKQRAAVCYKQFETAENKASVVLNNPWDEKDKILFFTAAENKNKPLSKSWKKAQGEDDPNAHYFDSKEKALKDAKKLGLEGFHTHKTEDGETLYMAGPSHKAFMEKHKQVLKQKKGSGG